MKKAIGALLASVLSCSAASVLAADAAANYPSKSVRFIAPFVPGGPSDTLSRLLAQKLTDSCNQQVIVDNRGGAGGIGGVGRGEESDRQQDPERDQHVRLRVRGVAGEEGAA